MLCHESIESYYSNNFSVLYNFHGDSRYQINNNITLDDIEDMLPFEREIYFSMIINKLKELQEAKRK